MGYMRSLCQLQFFCLLNTILKLSAYLEKTCWFQLSSKNKCITISSSTITSLISAILFTKYPESYFLAISNNSFSLTLQHVAFQECDFFFLSLNLSLFSFLLISENHTICSSTNMFPLVKSDSNLDMQHLSTLTLRCFLQLFIKIRPLQLLTFQFVASRNNSDSFLALLKYYKVLGPLFLQIATSRKVSPQ